MVVPPLKLTSQHKRWRTRLGRKPESLGRNRLRQCGDKPGAKVLIWCPISGAHALNFAPVAQSSQLLWCRFPAFHATSYSDTLFEHCGAHPGFDGEFMRSHLVRTDRPN